MTAGYRERPCACGHVQRLLSLSYRSQSNLEQFCEISESLKFPVPNFIKIRSMIFELFLASDGTVVVSSQTCNRFK